VGELKTNKMKKRIILSVIKKDNDIITVVTKENESIEDCLKRRCPEYKAYRVI